MNAAPELEEPRHVLRKRFSLKQVLCGLGELHFNRAQSSFLLSGKGWRPTCWMFKLSQDRQFKRNASWVELIWNLQNFWTWWAPKGPKFSSFRIKVKQWDGSLCPDNESRKQLIDKTVRVLPGLNPASKKKRLKTTFSMMPFGLTDIFQKQHSDEKVRLCTARI